MPTGSLLSPSTHLSPLEVAPLAHLRGGELVLLGPEFPPTGDLVLVLWHPGGSPPFTFVEGRVVREGRRWRFGATEEGYVVLWGPAPGHPERGS